MTYDQGLDFVWIAGSCQVNLWKMGQEGQDCSEVAPVSASPDFKVSQNITFFLYKCFLLLCFVYLVIIKPQNRRPNNTEKTSPQIKATKPKSKFYYSWVSLIVLWSTWPRSYAFRLAKIYNIISWKLKKGSIKFPQETKKLWLWGFVPGKRFSKHVKISLATGRTGYIISVSNKFMLVSNK